MAARADVGGAGSLGGRLRAARRRRFVGRAGEIELFSEALATGGGSFSVLFLHGPGGVGKSTVLDVLAEISARSGATPVRLDARLIQPLPGALLGAVAAAVGAGPEDDPLAAVSRRERPVLLLDTYELLAPLDGWVREEFLPALPADVLVVIASRQPPAPPWLADPAWRDLLRVVSVRNLSPRDARRYLTLEGVPESLHDRLIGLSHGHPLTLSLLVDEVRRRAADDARRVADDARRGADDEAVPRSLAEVPNLVRVLLGYVVESAPSPRHRLALELCAHARFTSEDLLRAVLGGADSAALFGWLRTLSFVEEGPHGLYPHDLARDVLDSDLRWRDRDGYTDLHRRVRSQLIEGIRRTPSGPERHRRVADMMFVARSQPAMARYLQSYRGNGESLDELLGGGRPVRLDLARIDELRGADRSAILEMTERHQGGAQAELVDYWIGRQPAGFRVFRGPDAEVTGYAARLALHEATEADLGVDPGVRAMHRYAYRHRPPRPGESVLAWRFFLDRARYHGPSPSLTLVAAWNVEEILSQDRCSWDFVGTYEDPPVWEPVMSYIDFARAPEADYEIGGRRYVVFAHDWRQVGVPEWLELTAERELGATAGPVDSAPPVLVLSQPEFGDAVRAALRDLHAPDRLGGSPLLRSRLVRDVGGEQATPGVLRDLLVQAAETLRADPRHEGLYRVLNRTFLRPAATQERAAELLNLSFSTYRRHRDQAVQRVVDWLWQRELYGPPTDPMR